MSASRFGKWLICLIILTLALGSLLQAFGVNSVRADVVTPSANIDYYYSNDERGVIIEFVLNKPQPVPVSFEFELVDGTFNTELLKWKLTYDKRYGGKYDEFSGSDARIITIPANSTVVYLTADFGYGNERDSDERDTATVYYNGSTWEPIRNLTLEQKRNKFSHFPGLQCVGFRTV